MQTPRILATVARMSASLRRLLLCFLCLLLPLQALAATTHTRCVCPESPMEMSLLDCCPSAEAHATHETPAELQKTTPACDTGTNCFTPAPVAVLLALQTMSPNLRTLHPDLPRSSTFLSFIAEGLQRPPCIPA